MLKRQRALVEMLRQADGIVSRLHLTKWSFLLRNSTESRGGSAFYDFLPYKYGPFSFALYQEMAKLEANGYVKENAAGDWLLGDVDTTPPDKPVCQDIQNVHDVIRDLTTDRLLDFVYDKYPEYTVNSERIKLRKRPTAPLAVYTAGYEGESIDFFLNRLVTSGVRRIVDVRRNPIARRYGFHRSTLAKLSSRVDIDYVHIPELGIRSEHRQDLATQADRDRLFDTYGATTLVDETDAIERAAGLCSDVPSVLICMEAEHRCCHRSRLADVVADHTGLPIKHL